MLPPVCAVESLGAGLEAGTRRAKGHERGKSRASYARFCACLFDLILVQHPIHEPIDTDTWRKQTPNGYAECCKFRSGCKKETDSRHSLEQCRQLLN